LLLCYEGLIPCIIS